MVNNIATKVLAMERSLERKPKPEPDPNIPDPIRVVSVYNGDHDLVSSVKRFESSLVRTRSFSLSDAHQSPEPASTVSRPVSSTSAHSLRTRSYSTSDTRPTLEKAEPTPRVDKQRLFQFVKKSGSSIRSRLTKVKDLALGGRFGETRPCGSRNCMCCAMVTSNQSYTLKTANRSRVLQAPALHTTSYTLCIAPYAVNRMWAAPLAP